MSVINALILSTLAGMSTVIGSIIIFFKIEDSKIDKFITFCLAFSMAIMIGISITDLILTSVFSILYNYQLLKAVLFIILSLRPLFSNMSIEEIINNGRKDYIFNGYQVEYMKIQLYSH